MSFPGLLSNASLLRATLPQQVVVDVRYTSFSHKGQRCQICKIRAGFYSKFKVLLQKIKKKKKKSFVLIYGHHSNRICCNSHTVLG